MLMSIIMLNINSENRIPLGRPKSAMTPTRYGIVTHPPSVVASGAPFNSTVSVPSHFKSDFQYEREEAWKSTTRRGKQRPYTATVQRSSTCKCLIMMEL